jgi:glutaredoxin 3
MNILKLLILVTGCNAFIPSSPKIINWKESVLSERNNNEDPTKTWYGPIVDAIQNVLTNSPLSNAKKALVKTLAGDFDEAAVEAKISNLVKENPVVMLSFVSCPFCIKAKGVLDSLGTKYTVVELDQVEDGKAIRAVMANMIGRTSVPAIWIGGTFVGGCNDGPLGGVMKLNESGQLKNLLANVGAI